MTDSRSMRISCSDTGRNGQASGAYKPPKRNFLNTRPEIARVSPAHRQVDERDILSIPEPVNRLMLDLRRSLCEIKPDVMLEFRQNYTGPAMLQYCNMFRTADCLNDALTNRSKRECKSWRFRVREY